jgi:hypothetical protein
VVVVGGGRYVDGEIWGYKGRGTVLSLFAF